MPPLHTAPSAARPAAAGDARLRPAARKAAGLHLLGDLHGCRGEGRLMHDATHLQAFCQRAVADAGLTAVGALFHSFGEGAGVTGVVVLAESHLSVHTWPEDGYVTLDVYVCSYSTDNRQRAQALFDAVVQAFSPAEPHLQRIERG
ncbi:adenosylmethionine decarboxylase [Ottowia oryzae]